MFKNSKLYILLKNNSFIFLYPIIYLLIFGKYFFSDGMPVGNDWSFPVFGYQFKNWLLGGLYAWSDNIGNIFGSRLSFSTALPSQFLGYTLNQFFQINGEFYQKILFIFSFLLGGLSSYFLFLKYNSKKFFAFLGGIIFTLNPVTFNFILMGWNFALLSFFSIPLILLFLEYYFTSKKIRFIVLIGLVFGIFGFMESQSIVHFLIFLFVYFFIKNEINYKSLREFVKIFGLIFLIIFGLHASWILLMFFVNDPYISSAVAQNDLIRFALRFSHLNIIRGWGSVFNYQFEYTYPKVLIFFSFLPPFLLLFLLIFKRIKNISWFFVFLFFYPFLMYLFSRHLSAHIPYTNVVRDFGRSFPYYFLATAFFITLIKSKRKIIKYLILFLLILCIIPFFNGNLYNVKNSDATGVSAYDVDQRLRLYQFNQDIAKIDHYIAQKKINKKGLVVPTGEAFIIPNDRKFNGMWAAICDYSYLFSDRIRNPLYTGNTQENMKMFFEDYNLTFNTQNCNDRINGFLKNLTDRGFFYIIIRKNVITANFNKNSNDIERCLNKASNIVLINDYMEYKLYEIDNKYFLPHFYTSQNLIISNENIDTLSQIVSQPDYKIRSVIYFREQNEDRLKDFLAKVGEVYKTKITPAEEIELSNGSFEEGLWQDKPGDCTNGMTGEPDLRMQLSNDSTEGKVSLELGSKNHFACTSKTFPVELSKNKIYKYSFDYKNVKGDRVQYYYNLYGEKKSYPVGDFIEIKDHNWNHFEIMIEPVEDIQAINLYFYAPSDGSSEVVNREVVNRFDNIKLVPLELNLEKVAGDNKEIQTPVLEFKKINPTKYIVRVHQAKESFPLVFSESFHNGWKAYLVERGKLKVESEDIGNYKILDGNEDDQASREELEEFIEGGWVSSLGDLKEKEIKHKKYLENGKEKLDHIEKYNIDFVSKNFQGTIQNDNLPKGHIWDTWFKKPLSEENHLMANGYANSWFVNLEEVKKSAKYIENPDGSIDFEMVVEFEPQKYFYLGLLISGMTLLGCLGYLGYDWKKRRNLKLQAPNNKSYLTG